MTSNDGRHIAVVALPRSLRYPKHCGAANKFGVLEMNSQALTLKKKLKTNFLFNSTVLIKSIYSFGTSRRKLY